MRVLIAEDSALERALLRHTVEGLGHECVVTADGNEAWARYQEHRADVVISDWLMPGLDGHALCQRVRALDSLQHYTYFIFLTMLEDREHALAAMRAGADDYLTKPLDRHELERRLIAAQRITELHRALAEARLTEGRLQGIALAGREMAHRVNNELAVVGAVLNLLAMQPERPAGASKLIEDAQVHLQRAAEHLQRLQRVTRVETWDTPVGPALDLARSVEC
ncbi:MAG: response regulator [Chloroflexi bacterium]|nr:response regulator [Chloroflexota bacterium]